MENKIGKFIASLRKEKGLTQQELGSKLFITDKAISKWERGLSLPDITILVKLAEVLEVDPAEILQGARSDNNKKDLDKLLEEEKNKIKEFNRKRTKMIIIPLTIIIVVLLIIAFKNIYLGYETKDVYYNHTSRNIKIGIPKLSFLMKHNDTSYSFKNLRSNHVLETEMKKYLKNLEYLTCNNTIYYYDQENNISIIDYSVTNHIFYNTISYNIQDGDYCVFKKLEEYGQYFILKGYHTMNGIFEKGDDITDKVVVVMKDGGNDKEYKFEIDLEIRQLKGMYKGEILLEKSKGTYEIKNNQLIYYRDKETIEGTEKSNIPLVSTFTLEDGYIILDDNYLSKYVDEIKIEGGLNKYKN